MKQHKIGNTTLTTGAIGLGCNKLIDPTNPAMVEAANVALDLGITMFDGADMYGDGRCEEFFAKIIKPRRDEALIVSKFGVVRAADGGQGIETAPAYVHSACNASLRRLQMDHIDLYYQHRMNPAVPIEDTIGAMVELKQAGKIGAIGISNTTPDLIRRAHAVHPLAAVQMEYSLMERGVEAEILDVCKELGITFVAWGPLTYAFLSGRVKSPADLPAGDQFRRRQTRFTEAAIQHNAAMLAVLDDIAADHAATPSQIALAWCLQRPFDILPIPGSTSATHLRENAAAIEIVLSAAQIAALDRTFAPSVVKGNVAAA
jgi:aryl-alcohol dehydrogenase-like predicted oxidoreductase